MDKEILAKTNPDVSLFAHSFYTCEKAIDLCKKSGCDDKTTALCAISSLFHDIGKYHPDFQEYLRTGEKSKEGFYEHTVLSAKIFKELVKLPVEYYCYYEPISKAILYHSPFDEKCSYLNASFCEDICVSDDETNTVKYIVNEFCNFFNNKHIIPEKIEINQTPSDTIACDSYFLPVSNFSSKNKEIAYINGVVRFSDIIVSGNLDQREYMYFSFNPSEFTFKVPKGYNKNRFNVQCLKANEAINSKNFTVLSAPAGFGKTLIGLKWMLSDNKKCIWVCPTNTIARGVYENIMNELKALGFDGFIKVGLLLTNEWEHGEEYGTKNDIIVTNIDNYGRPLFKSDEKKHMAFNFNFCNVIFDEYHKYIGDDALLATFELALWSRTFSADSKTLIMSATGNEKFFEKIKDVNIVKTTKEEAKTYYSKSFNICFSDISKLNDLKDVLYVRNSVKICQEVYKNKVSDNIEWLCYHSNFAKEDLKKRFLHVTKDHGKGGNKNTSVVATNIFTTGIDASFKNIVIGVCPFDEIIQTVGRLNRHGEYDENEVNLIIDESDFSKRNEIAAINAKYDYELCKFEYDFLKKNITQGKVSLGTLYDLREKLLEESKYKELYNKVFNKWKTESFKSLAKMGYNYSKKTIDSEYEYISDAHTLRTTDNNRFGKEYVAVFIKTVGMDNDTYMQISVPEEILFESLDYMEECLVRDSAMAEKYLGKKYNHILKNKRNSLFKMKTMFQEMAKCSKTPFLISPKFLKYNNEIGLFSTK